MAGRDNASRDIPVAVLPGRQTPGSSALHRAAREIVQAKQSYLACLDKFGISQWVSDAPIEAIIDTDLPVWMREDVEEAV